MNKRKINALIPEAYIVLKEVGIVEDEKISKAYRSQIASFGAAIMTGSLLSAIAYFSDKGAGGNEKIDRSKITKAIGCLIDDQTEEKINNMLYKKGKEDLEKSPEPRKKLFVEKEIKEKVLNAAIALKLAMNLYPLVDEVNAP